MIKRCALPALVGCTSLMGVFGCGGGASDGSLPSRAPSVGTWPTLRYEAQPPDPDASGISDEAEAKEIREKLEARYGEPFKVAWVSRETFSAPGWPGGVVGRFEAFPRAHPQLRFGGFNGQKFVDNYDCIRAVKPVLDWLDGQPLREQRAARHACLRSNEVGAAVQLWFFDDSERSPDELVAALRDEYEKVLEQTQAGAHPLARLKLTISQHPRGAGPAVGKVISTSRRAEHARHWARRRELFSTELIWEQGTWTRKDETPTHVRAVEDAVRPKVKAGAPANVRFEVERLGPADATIEDIARRLPTREAVKVHVRLDGEFEASELAEWIVTAQAAVDERLLLYWTFTLCGEGASRPWPKPEQCQAGWEEFTVFTLDDARKGPDYWPYPPAWTD